MLSILIIILGIRILNKPYIKKLAIIKVKIIDIARIILLTVIVIPLRDFKKRGFKI